MPGCKGLSGPVSPSSWLASLAGFTLGDRQRPGENQPNTRRENAQLRLCSVRESLAPPVLANVSSGCTNQIRAGAAASPRPGAGAAHIQARPSQAGGGGGSDHARPAASGPLLRRAGRGGDPSAVPGGPVGGRGG